MPYFVLLKVNALTLHRFAINALIQWILHVNISVKCVFAQDNVRSGCASDNERITNSRPLRLVKHVQHLRYMYFR